MALKKGICKNFDNCDLAYNKEIQEVDSSEFICAECGKELSEIQEETKKPKSKLLIIIIAAVVIIGGVVVGIVLSIGDEQLPTVESVDIAKENLPKEDGESSTDNEVLTTETQIQQEIATVGDESTDQLSIGDEQVDVVKEDLPKEGVEFSTNNKVATAETQPKQETATAGDIIININTSNNESTPQKSAPVNKVTIKNLGWAMYDGPMKNGKPHGIGGSLKVTKSYTIDLKDGRGSTLDVQPGETIENTKFVDGVLRAGELHRKDGTRPYFTI